MPARYIPSKEDAKIIRETAKRAAGRGDISLEAGIRCQLEECTAPKADMNINILLLTDDDDWEGTDLFDFMPWSDFRKEGVELTEDGRAEVDFYVRSRRELETNIQIIVENGVLVRINDTMCKGRWRRDGGRPEYIPFGL
jgi:hypothetical protein